MHKVYFNPLSFYLKSPANYKMRYSLEPKYRKYVPGYGFLSFARKFGNMYDNKLVNTGISSAKKFHKSKSGKEIKKQGIKLAKTSGKRILKKTAQSTGDLVGNLIANKITSLSNKQENDEQPEEQQQSEQIIIPPEKNDTLLTL